MSQKIITFDNEGRLLSSNLSNRYSTQIMYGDNNIDDLRNLAPRVNILKEIIIPYFFNKFEASS